MATHQPATLATRASRQETSPSHVTATPAEKPRIAPPIFSAARFSTNSTLTQFQVQYFPHKPAEDDSVFAQTSDTAYMSVPITEPMVLSHDIPMLKRPLRTEDVATLCFVQEVALKPEMLPFAAMVEGKEYRLRILWGGNSADGIDGSGSYIGLRSPQWPCGVAGQLALDAALNSTPAPDALMLSSRPSLRVLRTATELKNVKEEAVRSFEGTVKIVKGPVWGLDITIASRNDGLGQADGSKTPQITCVLDLGDLLAPPHPSLRDQVEPRIKALKQWQSEIAERIESLVAKGSRIRS